MVTIGSAAVAGALAGLALGYLGQQLPEAARRDAVIILAALWVIAGAIEALRGRVPLVELDRETPRTWADRSAIGWAVKNGASLGVGATTRVGFPAWYAVPTLCLLFASPTLGVAAYGSYAVTRVASVLLLTYAARRSGFEIMAREVFSLKPVTRQVAGGVLLALGTALLLAPAT
jgi:hypothetical protein